MWMLHMKESVMNQAADMQQRAALVQIEGYIKGNLSLNRIVNMN